MKIFASIILAAAAFDATGAKAESNFAVTDTAECADAVVPAGVDAADWLSGIETQAQLEHVFSCAKVPEALPTGRGRGWGSLRAGPKEWNELQKKIGNSLWGGKVFTDVDGHTTLLNLMEDSATLRYRAAVYGTTSIFDSKPSIVLDYRIDTTATDSLAATPVQAILDPLVHGIRDEIREVAQLSPDGSLQASEVYIGRAYLYTNFCQLLTNTTITDSAFGSASAYFLAANFFLDFRSAE